LMITRFAFVAAMFGHTVDSLVDFGVSKIPGVNNVLPQMPGPLVPVVNNNPVGDQKP
jgi:hypothetical protein